MKISYLILFLFFLSDNCFSQVTLKGTVTNTTDTVLLFFKNSEHGITSEVHEKRYKARIDKKGQFEITLPEDNIGTWMIEYDAGFQFFNLIKGQTIYLEGDFSKLLFPLRAIGNNAAEFNYSAFYGKEMNKKYFIHDSYRKRLRTKNIDSALQMRKEQALYEQKLLDEYSQANKMNGLYYQWLSTKYQYEPYERTMVENMDISKGISADEIKLLTPADINNDFAAMNCHEYNRVVEKLVHYHLNKMKSSPLTTEFFDIGSGDLLKGLTKQVFLSRRLFLLAKTNDDIGYQSLYEKYINLVSNTQLVELVDDTRNKHLAKVEVSRLSKENISSSASLNEIFSKYKGKVIYVDFWASWCAPCLSEMANGARLKKQLAGKDVVFVYLGYNDKKEDWLSAKEELGIEGEHYLLSAKLIEEADNLFDIFGIPHYVIIDKNGNIINKHADRPLEAYPELLKLEEEK